MRKSFKLKSARKIKMNSTLLGSVEVVFDSSHFDKPSIIYNDSKDDEKCLIDENSSHFYKKNSQKDK